MAFPVFSANLTVGAVELGWKITEVIDGPNAEYGAERFTVVGVPGFTEVADLTARNAIATAGLIAGDKVRVADTQEVYAWNGTAWRDLSPNQQFVDVADAAARAALDTTDYAVGDMVEQQDTGEIFVYNGANLVAAQGLDRHTGHGPILPRDAVYATYMATNLRGFDKTDDADGTPIGHYITDEPGTSGVWLKN